MQNRFFFRLCRFRLRCNRKAEQDIFAVFCRLLFRNKPDKNPCIKAVCRYFRLHLFRCRRPELSAVCRNVKRFPVSIHIRIEGRQNGCIFLKFFPGNRVQVPRLRHSTKKVPSIGMYANVPGSVPVRQRESARAGTLAPTQHGYPTAGFCLPAR